MLIFWQAVMSFRTGLIKLQTATDRIKSGWTVKKRVASRLILLVGWRKFVTLVLPVYLAQMCTKQSLPVKKRPQPKTHLGI